MTGTEASNMNLNTVMDIARLKAKPKLPKSAAGMNDAALDKVSQEFEAMFIGQMLQHMFEGVDADPLFGGGKAEKIYQSMLVDEYGKIISRTGGIGVADQVKRELIRLQEVE